MQHNRDITTTRAIWDSTVGYVRLANKFMPAIEAAVDHLAPTRNDHVLDIATGAGHAAVVARRGGAQVTGIDISPILISEADHYAVTNNLDDIQFDEGDAANLPYPNASFTVAISSFGLPHVENGERAVQELFRVLRPTGRVALLAWHADSLILKFYELLREYVTLEPSDIQLWEWGSPNRVREILDVRQFPTVQSRAGDLSFDYPDAAMAWQDWRTNYSPFRYAYTRLTEPQRERVDREAEALIEAHGTPFCGRYLLTVAQKIEATRVLG
ncbi:MAG: class I SAM-dependent methyltransferase [Chloroflexota bacterium]